MLTNSGQVRCRRCIKRRYQCLSCKRLQIVRNKQLVGAPNKGGGKVV